MTKKSQALNEFIAEIDEMLCSVGAILANAENVNGCALDINALYRNFHTIKGTAYIFGFNKLGKVAHAAETVLEPMRVGSGQFEVGLLDLFFAAVDQIKIQLESIKQTGLESNNDDEILRLVVVLYEAASNDLQYSSSEAVKDLVIPSETADDFKLITPPQVAENAKPAIELKKTKEASMENVSAEPSKTIGKPKESQDASSTTLRVNVETLNNLMNLVGELVLVRNQMLQVSKSSADQDLQDLGQRLNLITAELHDEVMKTRMQPVGNIFANFNRVVRDLSKDLEKKIELIIEGAETELDKSLLEAVKDPLTHVVRNSIDHGIEIPKDRVKAGKSEVGKIHIKAFHENGQVVIDVSDDGHGLGIAKIGSKAIEKGLITPSQLEKMSDRDIQSLIFAPGFSTAEKVSNVSGRGVGMDVVKTNIERTGGIVELQSTEGKGTSIRLKIPLTLAIIPALIVRAGHERFAVPQMKLLELVRVDGESDSSLKIEFLQGKPVFRLRGKLTPLVFLTEVLQISKTEQTKTAGVLYIAILTGDKGNFGLVVEDIEYSTDIVVKPLPSFLKDIGLYSGATVLGDASICLTIDVGGLSEKTGVLSDVDLALEERAGAAQRSDECEDSLTDPIDYVLIDINAPGVYAVPLTLIHRLEEFDTNQIEYSGEQRVINYRNTLLPIVSLFDFLKLTSRKSDELEVARKISIVVVKSAERLVGIEVNQILDIVTANAVIDSNLADRPGILGSLIYQDEVLVLIDVFAVVKPCLKHISGGSVSDPSESSPSAREKKKPFGKILFVEDNNFLRKHISTLLKDQGFDVDTASDGVKALEYLRSNSVKDVCLVLSDIEMPNMDGIELAKRIREDEKWGHVPLIAVTTHYNNRRIQEGLDAGFIKYLQKLDANELITEINRSLEKT